MSSQKRGLAEDGFRRGRRKQHARARALPSFAFAIQNLKSRFERDGGRSSMVELQIVILAVAGSSPVGHPALDFGFRISDCGKGSGPLIAQSLLESAKSRTRQDDAYFPSTNRFMKRSARGTRQCAVGNPKSKIRNQERFPLSTHRGREMEAALVFIPFWSAPNGHGCRLQREHADESEGESKHWSLRYGERANRKTSMPQEAHYLPVI